jgi:two-component system sensor histidine kinase QseC
LPTELVPMVDRLNDLLGRLDDAFNRERTFTADIAHELRTPLAGMLSTLEVCWSRPRDSAAYQETIEQCATVLRQMQGLVERLLLMARAEGGQLKAQQANVNLETLALECWMSFESRAREAGLTVAVETEENHAVLADVQLLQSVLKNLLDNAVSYARPGSRVRIVIRGEQDRVIAEVISEGHGLTEDDLAHVFDRFWRKDPARSKSGLHAGLGLGLCRRLLALQNGTLTVSLEGDAFIARLNLASAETRHRELAANAVHS